MVYWLEKKRMKKQQPFNTKNLKRYQPAVKKQSGLFSLVRWFLLIGIVVAVYFGWQTLRNPENFPIEIVKVEATYQHINSKTFQAMISPFVKSSFFGINTSGLKKELLTLPWVYSVSIKRIWPATIFVKIVEQQPIARWNDRALINIHGEIFQISSQPLLANLPLLTGSDDQAANILNNYRQLAAALVPLKLGIIHLDLDARGSWHATLSNNIEIIIGHADMIKRWQRFISAYPKLFADPQKVARSIDLRYPNGMAIQWAS